VTEQGAAEKILSTIDLRMVCVYQYRMEILEKLDSKQLKPHWLPLYSGELACGLFGISEDFIESYLSLDEKFMKNKESTFFVRAGGDSMSPEIKPSDILIIDRSIKPIHSSIVAIFFNGSAICKQLLLTGTSRALHSINPKYPDIQITESDEVQVFGVVIGLARDFN